MYKYIGIDEDFLKMTLPGYNLKGCSQGEPLKLYFEV